MPKLSRSQVLHIAWPIILSNVSTPLLGLVDTAVIGNLGSASLLGAIAIGGVIFSFLFWGFGFLRMGTTALTAQALGAKQFNETAAVFLRAAGLALAIGLLFILFRAPVSDLAFTLLAGSAQVEEAAKLYFDIRILGAPFSLVLLAVMGYLLGVQETKWVLYLNLLLNGLNIILDLIFVLGFGWAVEGVALATVISELTVVTLGLLIVRQQIRKRITLLDNGSEPPLTLSSVLSFTQIQRMFAVNRDIMIRTLCLIFAFAWFTDQGAAQGDVTLATNAILMQFVTFSAFFLDGFALASETLVGAAIGGSNQADVGLAIRYTFELGSLTALATSLTFWLLGPTAIDLLTNVPEVRQMSREFLFWAIAAPIVSVSCYLLDGIFIGATKTVEMRNAMIVSLILYLMVWYWAFPAFGNHGLWLALHSYFVARALTLAYYLPRFRQSI